MFNDRAKQPQWLAKGPGASMQMRQMRLQSLRPLGRVDFLRQRHKHIRARQIDCHSWPGPEPFVEPPLEFRARSKAASSSEMVKGLARISNKPSVRMRSMVLWSFEYAVQNMM